MTSDEISFVTAEILAREYIGGRTEGQYIDGRMEGQDDHDRRTSYPEQFSSALSGYGAFIVTDALMLEFITTPIEVLIGWFDLVRGELHGGGWGLFD